jgi:hypothetical protein
VDESLSQEIELATRTLGLPQSAFVVVSKPDLTPIIQDFERRFFKPGSGFRWERLREPSIAVSFSDGMAFRRLTAILPGEPELLWFVVEDILSSSLLLYRSVGWAIQEVIGGCSGFEYYIFPGDFDWLICENHHRFLIAHGQPVAARLEHVAMTHSNEVWQVIREQ